MTKTVLLVDDSASIRHLLRALLDGAGYAVLEAEHGARALQMLGALQVDLVLTDWQMPGMDGLALARAIRTAPSPRVRALPVVLLTGAPDGRDAEALATGVAAVLHKPFTVLGLMEALQRALPAVRGRGAAAAS